MALANGLHFIWLDTHIGVMGQHKALKEQFRTAVQPRVGTGKELSYRTGPAGMEFLPDRTGRYTGRYRKFLYRRNTGECRPKISETLIKN